MEKENRHQEELPSVSIEEALKLYLSIAVPGGLPEDIDPEVLLANLKTYIAQDRPDWNDKFIDEELLTPQSIKTSYSKIKQEIIQKALKPDIPTDPEELYLYQRRQEALQNRLDKNAEEKAGKKQEALVERLRLKKKENQEKAEKKKEAQIALLKNELKKKLEHAVQNLKPKTAPLSHESEKLSLKNQTNLENQYSNPGVNKWNSLKWSPADSLLNQNRFKNIDLSDNQKDKLVALDTFHALRRQNMYKREEVVKPLALKKRTFDIAQKPEKARDRFDNELKSEKSKPVKNQLNSTFESQVNFDTGNSESSRFNALGTSFSKNRKTKEKPLNFDQNPPKRSVDMSMNLELKFSSEKLSIE